MTKFKLIWIPRILIILFICFLSLFSFDAFAEGFSLMTLLGFFMHNIPTLILVGILYFTWYKPMIAGYIFLGMGILFGFFFDAFEQWISFLILILPLWIIGGIFLFEHYKK